jgi:hypothetical protein
VHARGGFQVYGANGVQVPCGPQGLSASCLVSKIDFTPMGLPALASKQVLADVGYDPYAVRLLFAGKVSGDLLQVWETWRAPDLFSTWAPLYTASGNGCDPDAETCTSAHSLDVNTWSAEAVTSLDFSSAPPVAECFTTVGGKCTKANLDAPVVQTSWPAGTLVTGSIDRTGTLHVQNYFLLISTGLTQSNDGYSYCTIGQSFCGDHQCTSAPPSCYLTHGRGRGLIDFPDPNGDPAFQSWQSLTGQLSP